MKDKSSTFFSWIQSSLWRASINMSHCLIVVISGERRRRNILPGESEMKIFVQTWTNIKQSWVLRANEIYYTEFLYYLDWRSLVSQFMKKISLNKQNKKIAIFCSFQICRFWRLFSSKIFFNNIEKGNSKLIEGSNVHSIATI